jgi:hypothetical protein
MSVLIERGPINPELWAKEYEKSQWPALMRERRDYIQRKIGKDCRMIVRFFREAKDMYRVCGFSSPAEMIEKGYALDFNKIRLAVEWLELNDPEEAVGINEVLTRIARADARDQANQRPRGGDRRSVNFKDDNINHEPGPDGTSQAQALRRLRHQRPDLHAKVLAGKLSPHAACIKAGFRHRMLSVRTDNVKHAIDALVRCYGRRAVMRAVEEL